MMGQILQLSPHSPLTEFGMLQTASMHISSLLFNPCQYTACSKFMLVEAILGNVGHRKLKLT